MFSQSWASPVLCAVKAQAATKYKPFAQACLPYTEMTAK
jgi:hypothetical protein